jgi:predicted phosphodiesterase
MNKRRPRLSETQNNYWQLKKLYDKKLYKVLLFSDPHGWLADLSALRCINQILQHNNFDEVCINGDIVDLPYISRHSSKLYEDGILAGYGEVKEIEYTKEQILNPLRLSTDANIRVRIGNHDERIVKPVNIQQSQLARLAILYKNFETTQFETMLGLKESEGYIYDASDIYTYFDKFDVTHGLSLAKNAPEKNIQEYMSSGATGHTHRLNSKYLTNRKAPYVWLELGCTRLIQQVEYFPTGKVADWQNGFATVFFYTEGDKVRFYAQPHIIIEGRCYFNGVVYDGNVKQGEAKAA